jgi:DNA-binding response OmpR family regulator
MSDAERVLVVDDDHAIRNLLRVILRRRELEVDTAADGEEALRKMAAVPYRVLLLDLMMPQVDGHAFLETIAHMEENERPLVLVITASDDSELRRLDRRTVAGIIRKPFDIVEVADLVTACIHRSPAERAADRDRPPVELKTVITPRIPISGSGEIAVAHPPGDPLPAEKNEVQNGKKDGV